MCDMCRKKCCRAVMLLWLCSGGGGGVGGDVCTGQWQRVALPTLFAQDSRAGGGEMERAMASSELEHGSGWLARWLARITNHPTIAHINMATTLDRHTPIDFFIATPIHILRS